MSRTNWKQRERDAARILNGRRYTANQGGLVDCESDGWCAQVKERRVASLHQLEQWVWEIERVAAQKNKLGVLMVKRSAGRGKETPWLMVVTEAVWREMNGAVPGEAE